MIRTIFAGLWLWSIIYVLKSDSFQSWTLFSITTLVFIISVLLKEYLNGKNENLSGTEL